MYLTERWEHISYSCLDIHIEEADVRIVINIKYDANDGIKPVVGISNDTNVLWGVSIIGQTLKKVVYKNCGSEEELQTPQGSYLCTHLPRNIALNDLVP